MQQNMHKRTHIELHAVLGRIFALQAPLLHFTGAKQRMRKNSLDWFYVY